MTHQLRYYLFAALLAFSVLVSSSAWAEGPPEAEPEQAETEQAATAADYYEEASQAYADGAFARAAELLARAYEHDPNPIYRYNEILAHQGAGHYEKALQLLQESEDALRDIGLDDDIAEIRTELTDAIEARDEAVAEETRAPAPSEELDPPTETEDADGTNLLAWSLIGSSGALFAGSALFGSTILISDTVDRLENSTTAYEDSTFSYEEDRSTLRTHRIITVALLAGGVVTAATGTTMILLDGGSDTDTDGVSLRLEPMVDVDGGGALVRGRF